VKTTILSVGKVRQSFIKEGEQEYLKRIKSSFSVQCIELGLEAPESLPVAEIQDREAREVLKRLDSYERVVVLDERGKDLSSHDLSTFLQKQMNGAVRSLAFVIGGAFGFSEKVRQRADLVLSLSTLTMPHQLVRLILVEQLYRAHTILKGISYHK
jgi:23S rRNA (pseudouridine1915-N3)-methyltransferase